MSLRVVCLFHRGFKLFPRGFKELEALDEAGYDVEVLCTSRSKLPEQEVHKGITIRRIPVPWPDWPLLKPFAMFYSIGLLYLRARRSGDVDVFHCFGIYSLLAGVLLCAARKTALTYDAFEDYYYQTERSGILGPLSHYPAAVVRWIEGHLVARSDRVFTVPSADDVLEQRFSQFTDAITTVENVPRLSEGQFESNEEITSDHEDTVTFLYVGGMAREKGSTHMLRVAERVIDRAEQPVEFLFIGSFHDDSEAEVRMLANRAHLSEHIELLGFVPYEQVGPYLRTADVALHLYQPTSWHEQSRGSSKLFRYMAAGLPIVVSDFPGIGQIVSEADCGLPVDPQDAKAAADAGIRLLEDKDLRNRLGENGIEAFSSTYNWDVERETFIQGFNSVVV